MKRPSPSTLGGPGFHLGYDVLNYGFALLGHLVFQENSLFHLGSRSCPGVFMGNPILFVLEGFSEVLIMKLRDFDLTLAFVPR